MSSRAAAPSLESMLDDLRRPAKKRKSGCSNEENVAIIEALVELMNEASTRHSDHLKHSYARAIGSIKKCPLPIRKGDDAKQLRGVGDFIANKIQMILIKLAPIQSADERSPVLGYPNQSATETAEQTVQAAPKLYLPAPDKSPWFILMALWQAKAIRETACISLERLSTEIRLIGDDQDKSKIKRSLHKLVSTHKVVSMTVDREYYLNERGLDSAQRIAKSKLGRKKNFHKDISSGISVPVSCRSSTREIGHPQVPLRTLAVLNSSRPSDSSRLQPEAVDCIIIDSSSEDEMPVVSQPNFTPLSSSDDEVEIVVPEIPHRSRSVPSTAATAAADSSSDEDVVEILIRDPPVKRTMPPPSTFQFSSSEESDDDLHLNATPRRPPQRYVSSQSSQPSSSQRRSSAASSSSSVRPGPPRYVPPPKPSSQRATPRPPARSSTPTTSNSRVEEDTAVDDDTFLENGVAGAFSALLTSNRVEPVAGTYETPDTVALPEDEWEVVLLLDHREKISKRDSSLVSSKLLQKGVNCVVRSLNIGDIMWVARRYRQQQMTEYVMDVIIERKTINDLNSSILDKRFIEQKDRLEQCGLEKIVYLVEGTKVGQTAVRGKSVTTAMAMTQIHHNFLVQTCASIDETVDFLAEIHRELVRKFPRDKYRNSADQNASSTTPRPTGTGFDPWIFLPSKCRTFQSFNEAYSKRQKSTVHDLFQSMLMQIPGFSSARVRSVTEKYPTFQSLYETYKALPTLASRDKLVQDLKSGGYNRRLGPKCSETLSRVFNPTR